MLQMGIYGDVDCTSQNLFQKMNISGMNLLNTFCPHGVYTLRGPSSHQSGRPLNLKIPCAGVF